MNKLPIYQIDAFASTLFSGNPAAVCPLNEWLKEALMQAIAKENNLSETAFFVRKGNEYEIRWFTPNTEVDLCGHATLASAYVIFEILKQAQDEIIFQSKSGILKVKKSNQLLELDFPALPYTKIAPSTALLKAINIKPKEVFESTFDLLLIFEKEEEVREAKLDLYQISQIQKRGVILSAASQTADIYSRCFYPGCDVPEDPVTGSAHCVIAPYWCEKLGKQKIHARQGGNRQGEIWCEVKEDRVFLQGTCQLYMEGFIFIPQTFFGASYEP